jgi:tetratricopeptide (TPR) repeat protein
MLTPTDATLGHRLAAEWLEQKSQHEWLSVAEHYERGARPFKAIDAYRRACEQALEGNDFASAIARAERGIACGATGEARGTLLWLSAEALFWRGDFADAAHSGMEAAELFQKKSGERFAVMGVAAEAASTVGDHDTFGKIARALREASPDDEDAIPAYVVALAHTATRLLYHSAHQELDDTLDAIERCIKRVPWESRAFAGWVNDARSTRAMGKGDMAACLRLMDQAAKDFTAAGDLRNACRERGHVGYAYMDLGVYDEAERALREAMNAARRLGLVHVVATAKHNLGKALQNLGRLDDAFKIESEAYAELSALSDPRLAGAASQYLAGIALQRNELDVAVDAAARALSLSREQKPRLVLALSMEARVLLAMGKNDEALSSAEHSMDLLRTLGNIEEGEAEIRLAHIEALLANGLDAEQPIREALAHVADRAEGIRDEHWRQCFLEKVPEHARIVALAAGHVGQG